MKKLFHQFKTLFSNNKKSQSAQLSPEQIAKIKESSAEFTTVLDSLKQDLLKISKDQYLKDLNKKATEKKPTAKKAATPVKKTATAKKTTPATKPAVKKASPKKPSK